MKAVRASATVIARFLLSTVFLTASINKIVHWGESEQLFMSVLSDWQSHLSFSDLAQRLFTSLILFTPVLLILGTVMELVGSLLLLLGVKEKWGAALLLTMLVPATILFHQFWFIESSMKEVQQAMFLKNFAIMGGLILVLLYGAQPPEKKGDSSSGGSFKFTT